MRTESGQASSNAGRGRGQGLPYAVLASLILHGALLALLALPLPDAPKPGAGGPLATRAALPLRVTFRGPEVLPAPESTWHPAPKLTADNADNAKEGAHLISRSTSMASTEAVAGEGSAPLPTYFPLKALTREPQPTREFVPVLPPLPVGFNADGRVTLRVWIGPQGTVDKVEPLTGNLPRAYVEAALAEFRKMIFVPGQINRVPVGTWADVVVEVPETDASTDNRR